MSFDMTAAIKPKSDQVNADDLLGGDLIIKITDVKQNSDADQPVSVCFQGDNGKPYKPCKGMRRIMVAAWGKMTGAYVGNRMELFREASVTFGKLSVGGIQISKMSNVTNPKNLLTKNGNKYSMVITAGRGKKVLYEFEEMPNTDAPAATFFTTSEERTAWLAAQGKALDAMPDDTAMSAWLKTEGKKSSDLGEKQQKWLADKIAAAMARLADAPKEDDVVPETETTGEE